MLISIVFWYVAVHGAAKLCVFVCVCVCDWFTRPVKAKEEAISQLWFDVYLLLLYMNQSVTHLGFIITQSILSLS